MVFAVQKARVEEHDSIRFLREVRRSVSFHKHIVDNICGPDWGVGLALDLLAYHSVNLELSTC